MARTIGLRKKTITVPTAGTPVPIFAAGDLDIADRFVPDFEVYVPSGNTGVAYIGNEDVDNTWIPRAKSSYTTFTHGEGTLLGPNPSVGFDLSKVYVDVATGGDQVIIQYIKGDS